MNLISMNTKCFCLEYNENLYEIFKNVQNNITVIHWKYKKNDFAFWLGDKLYLLSKQSFKTLYSYLEEIESTLLSFQQTSHF